MTRPAAFKQDEVKRAVAGVKAAGVDVARVEVDPITGKVVIFAQGAADSAQNPWDRLHR